MLTCYRIKWIESERGWGTRDDGYSLHLTLEHAKKYVDDYWNGMPDSAPETYSRPDCEPYLIEIEADVHNKLKKKKNLRF